ncbi:MAG: VWA domain-containing protein, partial [Pyrinomonadaceae bacterium]|nr:VWA domain-containing protein [Pyrinomonadaceae bacterium]
MDSDVKPKSANALSGEPEASSTSVEQELQKQLSEVKNASERQSILELTRGLTHLSLDRAAATLETSAAIAGISLRASIEFLRAAPEAAEILTAGELRLWGEMGRRLAIADVETAISFFLAGVGDLKGVPPNARAIVFQLCSRQMTLSAPVATATLRKVAGLAAAVNDSATLVSALETAAEISRRSAKHSADFLTATPAVIECLDKFYDPAVKQSALALASAFAFRAGGIAADAWAAMPTALANLKSPSALNLLDRTGDFLERGGGGALHLMLSGGEVLRVLPELFEDWVGLLWAVAQHGNASLVAFVRSTPRFVRGFLGGMDRDRAVELSQRVVSLTEQIALLDAEAALACFRASPGVLRTVAIEQFEEWAKRGLSFSPNDTRARRSYFALETRGSYEVLHSDSSGLALESIQHLLRLYIEALTGREVELAPIAAVPVETRIGDGRTIHLPAVVAEFGDDDLDFRLYKALAAHAAGQIEFATHECDTVGLRAAYSSIAETYDPANVDALDAFALDGYINDPQQSEAAKTKAADTSTDLDEHQLPQNSDYRAVLALFPHSQLARRIFGTLENGRIDARLRRQYRGLARDLDLIREHLRRSRKSILDLPATLVPFELLFQITLLGGALDDSRQYYGQVVSELERVAAEYLADPAATVADTLMATSRVYTLFQSVVPVDDSLQQLEMQQDSADTEDQDSAFSETLKSRPRDREPQRRDARELFNAWNDPNSEGDPDELEGGEAWIEAESPEQKLEEGEVAYNYDEWDRELTDHRLAWCRVIEKQVKHGDRLFVDQTRDRHRGVISSIRRQFQLLKPDELTRVANELDGEEYDLNAVVDFVLDRRAAKVGGGHQSERIYMKRLRRRRDVAVSFLLDQSSSTARTIGRHPLQPYTHPGRRIIEIEKEGLVLMSEALEAVGDIYSINGFTSEGRRNVKFYVVKDFDEKYSDEVKRRIGGITYQNNTRLGAAIRHATAKLAKQQVRTRLLIVLSDGRPYDHDYGDARYAREDTREALRQAKVQGITPFCITIDRE